MYDFILNVYEEDERTEKIQEFLWLFYMGPDTIISTSGEPCMIGGISCAFPTEFPKMPENGSAVRYVPVEAGVWESRILADSKAGKNEFCHTLVPNVTVDFEKSTGNGLLVKFTDNFMDKYGKFFKIYVHDMKEHVALDSYALVDIPYITIYPENRRQKWQISPSKHENFASRPNYCNKNQAYSENLCKIQYCWDKRIHTCQKFFGDKFNCILPGIITSYDYPICKTLGNWTTHAAYGSISDAITLGMLTLMKGKGDNSGR